MRFSLKSLQRITLGIFLIVGVAGALDVLAIEKFLLPLGIIMAILVFYDLDLPEKITREKSRLLNMIISFWAGFMPVTSTIELILFRVVYLSSMPILLTMIALKWRDRFGMRFIDKFPELLFASFSLSFLMVMFGGWEYSMFVLLALWTSNFFLEFFSTKLRSVLSEIEESENVFWRLVFGQLYGFGPLYLMLLFPVAFVTLSTLVVFWELLLLSIRALLQHGFSAFLGMFFERAFQLVSIPYFIYQFYLLMKLMRANSSKKKDMTILPLSIVTGLFSILMVWYVFARYVRSDSVLGFINELTRWQLWRSEVRIGLTIAMLTNLIVLTGMYVLKRSSPLTLQKRVILSLELGICGIVVFLYLLGDYFVIMLAFFAVFWFLFQSVKVTSLGKRRLCMLGVFVSSIVTWVLGTATNFFRLFGVPVEFLWLLIGISGFWLTYTFISETTIHKSAHTFEKDLH